MKPSLSLSRISPAPPAALLPCLFLLVTLGLPGCSHDGEGGVQVFDGAEPLGADFFGILGADVAAGLDETDDAAVVVDEDDLGGVAEYGAGTVAYDVHLCHGLSCSSGLRLREILIFLRA